MKKTLLPGALHTPRATPRNHDAMMPVASILRVGRGHINRTPDLQVQSGLVLFTMVTSEVQRLVQSGLLWFSLVQHPGLSLMWPLVTLKVTLSLSTNI